MSVIRFFTIILLLSLFNPFYAISQVKVDITKDLNDVVKSLEGPGVQISNITWSIPSGAPTPPVAYFEDQNNYTGIDKGILLTTGSAQISEGPNDSDGLEASQDNNNSFQDPLLASLANETIYDFCAVEFDIVTSSSTLSFDYVFASEEYTEYWWYSDVFALTISGPGISGTKNLAVVPGTNSPVSVITVNNSNNSAYYRNNFFMNPELQYDGLTTVLTAATNVIPCETYRIRLAIADAIDAYWDSGVFIRQGSFKSEDPPIISVTYEHPEFDYAIENCNNAIVKFERPATMSDTIELIYKIQLTGTAINGTDYTFVKDTVIIPVGEQAGFLTIEPIADNVKEGIEIVKVAIGSPCPQFPDIVSYEFPLRDIFPYSIPTESLCYKDSIQLNKNPQTGTSITWEPNSELSCTNCLSPIVKPNDTDYYSYTITHDNSDCQANDSVLVEVTRIIPAFTYHSDECYTSADITFTNSTTDASQYLWTFGDGENSTDANPIHTYPFNNTRGSVQYSVTLKASSSSPSCLEEVTKTVVIADPLFIPNLLTADNNGKNEEFRISGLGAQCWTLYLYNRWGSLVYKQENYRDQLRGSQMEPGTYYYLIENDPGDRSFSGWIHILH